MKIIAIISSDRMEAAGIFQADDSLSTDDLAAEALKYGYTLDAKVYAGGAPYIDQTVRTMPEFRAYISTVDDPATD
jgi:hypothetical protein